MRQPSAPVYAAVREQPPQQQHCHRHQPSLPNTSTVVVASWAATLSIDVVVTCDRFDEPVLGGAVLRGLVRAAERESGRRGLAALDPAVLTADARLVVLVVDGAVHPWLRIPTGAVMLPASSASVIGLVCCCDRTLPVLLPHFDSAGREGTAGQTVVEQALRTLVNAAREGSPGMAWLCLGDALVTQEEDGMPVSSLQSSLAPPTMDVAWVAAAGGDDERGLFVCSAAAVQRLITWATTTDDPLAACTTYGIDNGCPAIAAVSWHRDVLSRLQTTTTTASNIRYVAFPETLKDIATVIGTAVPSGPAIVHTFHLTNNRAVNVLLPTRGMGDLGPLSRFCPNPANLESYLDAELFEASPEDSDENYVGAHVDRQRLASALIEQIEKGHVKRPRLSLRTMWNEIDQECQLAMSHFGTILPKLVQCILQPSSMLHQLVPVLRAWQNHVDHLYPRQHKQMICVLHDVTLAALKDPLVATRVKYATAAIAEYAALCSGISQSLRLGPAKLPSQIFTSRSPLEAVNSFMAEQWRSIDPDDPSDWIRLARFGDAVFYAFVREELVGATTLAPSRSQTLAPIGQPIEATCPVRIDLAGGWSDTPPISYDHGSVVMNLAVKLDGKRPIGARVTRLRECVLEFELVQVDGYTKTINITSLDDMRNYNDPLQPGALIKAAFLACGLVRLDPPAGSLEHQLMGQCQGGFRVCTWSNVPQGSGLGTSSILAATLLAALSRASGRDFGSPSKLVHRVLSLEQLLTTGGGWQDQVGGIFPGAKIARSAPALPLRVDTHCLVPKDSKIVSDLETRLLLIYTGTTRLARDLLQSVLRRWALQQPATVATVSSASTVKNLVDNAERCADAFIHGEIAQIGKCVSTYWDQKKAMAGSCEPPHVRQIMQVLEPHVHGQSMAGAGGGGFMYCITKEPNDHKRLEAMVRAAMNVSCEGQEELLSEITFHRGTIDNVGLAVVQGLLCDNDSAN